MKNLKKLLIAIAIFSQVCVRAQTPQTLGGDFLYAVANVGTPLPSCSNCYTTTNGALNSIFSSYGVTLYDKAFPSAQSSLLGKTYRINATGDINALKSALETSGYFDNVYVSATYVQTGGCPTPVTINDPWTLYKWSSDMSLDMTDAYCAWTLTHGDPNLNVAVVDSEVDPNHPDFNNKVTVKTANTIPTWESHGTRSTGVVCAQTNNSDGVASIGYDLRVNFYSEDANGLMKSIYDAYVDGAKVINISYAIVWMPIEIEMIKEVIKGGCTPVFGAGNWNTNTWDDFWHEGIWNIPGAVIVSGVGQDNRHASTAGTYGVHSDYPGVDLCSISIGVGTLDKDGTNNIITDGWGTSFAAPQVTATIGLMLSVNPCLTPPEIESILKSTTDPIDDAIDFPGIIGTGRLNVYKAVLKAQNWGNEHLIVDGVTKTLDMPEYFANVTVKNGGILNIQNTTVKMADHGKITIEPGSRLNVINSEISAQEPSPTCEFQRYKWDGIAVNGNSGSDQTTNNQGYIFVQNSTIRDASNAISTYALDGSGNIYWPKTGGGIIKCKDATFKNNGRHIAFYSYKRPNGAGDVSSFIDCQFEVEGVVDVSGGARPNVMITAWDVKGVTFSGCTYTNTNGSIDADLYKIDRGTGILTVEAQLVINSITNKLTCQDIKRGSFYDLSRGIESYFAPSTTIGHIIKKQDFSYTDRGIILSNGLATSIYKNSFDLNIPSYYYNREQSVSDPNYNTGIIGIFTNGATGYRIEENTFDMPGSKVFGEIIAPVVMQNTDQAGGGAFMRLNTLNNSNIGIQTQQNNAQAIIACNTMYDVGVSGHLSNASLQLNLLSTTGKTPTFGTCNSSVADARADFSNTFSNNTIDGYHGPSKAKTYVVKLGEPLRPTTEVRMNYAYCENSGLSVVNYGCDEVDQFKEPCERTYSDWPGGEPRTRFGFMKTGGGIIKGQIDDGSSPDLLLMVQQGPSVPAGQVYATLIDNSPYLSSEILIAMITNSTHLSEQEQVDILLANTGLSEQVLEAIEGAGFSGGAWDQINEAQDANPSALENASNTLEYYQREMMNARNDVILRANLMAAEDSILNWTDTIIAFLQEEDDLESHKLLLGTFYSDNRLDQSLGMLSTIEAENDETEETNDFIAYYSLLLNLKLEDRNIFELTDNETNFLTDLASHTSAAAEAAKGVLSLVHGQMFDLFIERLAEDEFGKGTTGLIPSNVISNTGLKLKVYPNPASMSTEVSFALTKFKRQTTLKVLDIAGREVYSQSCHALQATLTIETEEWKNGLYIIQLISDGELMGTQKLLIQH